MPTAVVTGAAGYVGSGLVGVLEREGWRARPLVRERVPYLGDDQVVLDLSRDGAALAGALEDADVVVHLAGDNEAAPHDHTASGTENLARAVEGTEVKRVLYMSTVHVYGTRMVGGATLTEDLAPEPEHPYAIARLASERLLESLRPERAVVIFRLTNSVGAPVDPAVERWTLVANDLSRQGAVHGRLELRTPGTQWRDFVALRDVREMVAAACRPDPVPSGTYNIGSGRPLTVRDLAGLVQDAFEDLTGERPELHAPEPEGERPEPYRVSVEAAARSGLRAVTPLQEAVGETVRFCIENKEALAR